MNTTKVIIKRKDKREIVITYDGEYLKTSDGQAYHEPDLTHPDQVVRAIDYHEGDIEQFSLDNGRTWNKY